jgi:hypothetical protein
VRRERASYASIRWNGGRERINGYTDQAGNPVSREHMFRLFSESMLANVII